VLIDARELSDGARVDTDLCIVGAGAAGIALAREWIGSRRSVVLLESGGFKPDPATQDLYAGDARGNVLASPQVHLTRTRLRYFGGTTNHWGGYCRPLGPLDFRERSWVSESGWPFGPDELASYYDRALPLIGIPPFAGDFDQKQLQARPALELGASGRLETSLIHLSRARFGPKYRDEIVNAPNVSLILHGNAVELESDAADRRVSGLRAACLEGPRFTVRARAYVLATGGIENARLLLASRGRRLAGLGNENDLVGRFFMDHVSLEAGRAVITMPVSAMSLYRAVRPRGRVEALGLLTTREDAQVQGRLLGFSARLQVEREPDTHVAGESVLPTVYALDRLDQPATPPAGSAREDAFLAGLLVVAEQSPNRDSRVALSRERDALGSPRARLDWQVRRADYASIARSLELLAADLGRASRGRVQLRIVPSELRPRTQGWSHHMGTTRMHADAKRGVVDPHCRMHSVENLYVAGSSVFPTGGSEGTTTFTLLALTLRLSDHLKRKLGA
jgi:choline dehydrogenase-like flavoprotein